MSDNKPSLHTVHPQDKIDSWFSGLIDFLKVDHFLMQTGTASKEKREFYEMHIGGDENALAMSARMSSSMHFIKKIVLEYLDEILTEKARPELLALGITESKILVWAQINDDDCETEDKLLLSEAKINNKYHEYGFYISSIIIEKSDKLPVPPHYQTILE